MERILHDDWSIRFGENRSDQLLKHLAAMHTVKTLSIAYSKQIE